MADPAQPRPGHFLGDLGFENEVITESHGISRTRVTPHITGADGGVRAGVLATLVDVVGGMVGIRALSPHWMVTADLSVEMVRPAIGPYVEARASVLRKGRTTMVIEAPVFNVLQDGTDVPDEAGRVTPAAWSTLTFAVLRGADLSHTMVMPSELPWRSTIAGNDLDRSLVDALSVSVLHAGEGRVSLPVAPYLHNSIGAVQGGAMALLGEVAGVEALGAAAGTAGASVVITDLQVAYLTPGRVGPITTRARVLDGFDGTTGGSAVIELVDEGADGRLTTVINVRGEVVDTKATGGGAADDEPIPVAS